MVVVASVNPLTRWRDKRNVEHEVKHNSRCRYCEAICAHKPHTYDFGDGKFYHCHGSP